MSDRHRTARLRSARQVSSRRTPDAMLATPIGSAAVAPALSAVSAPAQPSAEPSPAERPEAVSYTAQEHRPRLPLPQAFGQWLRARPPEQWAFFGITFLAAVLRLWGLADKPLHHDESLHAYYSLQFFLNPSGYVYDPLLHGPFQFHIIPIIYAVAQGLGLPDHGVNDFTARLLPAILGTAMVPLPYGLRRHLGRWGALSAAFILAVSPSFVYYSRFVRDDIYVTFFALLLVVAAIQYGQTRKVGWLLTAVAALTLSYTAMENTFFIIAIFGAFLIALLLWDLGPIVGERLGSLFAPQDRALGGRVLLLAPFLVILAAAGLVGLHWLSQLSAKINQLAATHTSATDPLNPDVTVHNYEQVAVAVLLLVSIVIAGAVIVTLIARRQWDSSEDLMDMQNPGRWRRWVNPGRQPVLDTLLSTHWIRWFLAFVVAWVIFAVFFWELPADPLSLNAWGTGFSDGIGKGLLQGIYYWLEQQQVARGGQPWYYYMILIPLYEPLILVFGIAGLVRSLVQPTRFRLFVAFWFVANMVLYSWAGEKMPWLVIHILLPMVLLAGIALEWIVSMVIRGARSWWTPTRWLVAIAGGAVVAGFAAMSVASTMAVLISMSSAVVVFIGAAATVEGISRWHARRQAEQRHLDYLEPAPHWVASVSYVGAAASLALAVILLVPTVWNMQRVAFDEPSVAPNEMLVYTQTTTDVQLVMDKIDSLDQKLYGGQHKLKIGVTSGAVWPFAWYLRDYPSDYVAANPAQHLQGHPWTRGTIFNYTAGDFGIKPDVIIADIDNGGSATTSATYGSSFAEQQYRLRWWWDESYKPPVCSGAIAKACVEPNSPEVWGSGVGPLLWISYGANPPPACPQTNLPKCDPLLSKPNGADAAQRYWNWLWLRQNISGTAPGSTNFVFYVRSDLTSYEKP
jgi:uncharacterized protein (TIGR03663 family)